MSSIIKGGSAGVTVVRALAGEGMVSPTEEARRAREEEIFRKAREEAEAALAKAKSILEAAERKAEAAEREAYERGFAQGEKAGESMGLRKVEPAFNALTHWIQTLSDYRQQLVESHEAFILQMGFLAAAHILHQEVQVNEEAVLGNIRASLHMVSRSSRLRLRVSAQDYKIVEAHRPELIHDLTSRDDFKLEADAQMTRGGCWVTGDIGDIDAQIDSQLATLREAMMGLAPEKKQTPEPEKS